MRRSVKRVQVTYVDGTTESFETQEGWYRRGRNYDKLAKYPSEGWDTHEIHWNDRAKEAPDGGV